MFDAAPEQLFSDSFHGVATKRRLYVTKQKSEASLRSVGPVFIVSKDELYG